MNQPFTVRRAGADDADGIIGVYRRSSSDEVVNDWIFGDSPEVYAAYIEQHMPGHVAKVLARDEVWVAARDGEIACVAVMSHVGDREPFEQDARDTAEAAEAMPDVPALQRAARALRFIADHQPTGPEHLYVANILTDRRHRSQGAGGALLEAVLADADERGLPVYLEASTERSAKLYTRVGFADTGERLRIAEDSPTLIPCWYGLG
ncbi:GNAT family N-acetyltransferase [Salininema proteolyticum]|uniref:GNAT family N-acetyltransferase n=1 Tax=Salininema proteolyticum TaxID=1607685 RepID=A0ABV8TYD1_9ACTN